MRLHLPLLLSLAATPASADLVISGRDAQKLQCAAMVLALADHLEAWGEIPPEAVLQAQGAAMALIAQIPGSERDRVQALLQRIDKLRATRSPSELAREFERSTRWCALAAAE